MRSLLDNSFVSVTLTHAYLFAATVGVPVTYPVVEFRDSPGGRDPSTTENEYGVVPPVAEILPE